jgi:hypothetical protein
MNHVPNTTHADMNVTTIHRCGGTTARDAQKPTMAEQVTTWSQIAFTPTVMLGESV